jgi:hypothetical protein
MLYAEKIFKELEGATMKEFSVKAFDKNDLEIFTCSVIAKDDDDAYDQAYEIAFEDGIHLDMLEIFIDEERDLNNFHSS